MAGRREAAHRSFPLSSRLVRIFCLGYSSVYVIDALGSSVWLRMKC
jgi:hypothetical protein